MITDLEEETLAFDITKKLASELGIRPEQVEATIKLIEQMGGEVVGCAFLIELVDLKGRELIKGYNVKTLIQY